MGKYTIVQIKQNVQIIQGSHYPGSTVIAGRQVPIFSYYFLFFSADSYFSAISSHFSYFFSHFTFNLYFMYFFSGVSFQLFFFLKCGTPIVLKNFPVSLHLASFHAHIIKNNYLDFCIWPWVDWDGCRSTGRNC